MDTTSKNKNGVLKNAASSALIIGLGLILLSTIDYTFKLYGQKTFLGLLSYAIMIGGVVFFTIKYRDKVLGGYMTYSQSLVFGILLVMFASLLSGIFISLLTIIDPAYTVKRIELIADALAQKGVADNMIEQSLKMTRIMMNPIVVLLSSLFSGAIFGALISLITSIFTKKQKSIF